MGHKSKGNICARSQRGLRISKLDKLIWMKKKNRASGRMAMRSGELIRPHCIKDIKRLNDIYLSCFLLSLQPDLSLSTHQLFFRSHTAGLKLPWRKKSPLSPGKKWQNINKGNRGVVTDLPGFVSNRVLMPMINDISYWLILQTKYLTILHKIV
jgi:hypothetical protein